MAKKYFLGSVGTAEAFRRDEATGKLRLAFRSKTLTDSGLNISTTKDDIRAGTGAPIQFSFYHDPSVEITLTDVLFDEAYIEAQLGASFEQSGEAYMSKELESDAQGQVTLPSQARSIIAGCSGSEILVWCSKVGANEWFRIDESNIGEDGVTISGLEKETHYCFRWIGLDDNARIATITSNIIPQELFLVITAPIFSGDACSASNGKAAGTITFEIPRFKLNGAQDFAMNMSSNQTMSLSGTALATEDGCDATNSKLLRIIAQYNDLKWYDNVESWVLDSEFDQVGKIPHIYAIYNNGSTMLVDNSLLTFPSGALDGSGQWSAAGAYEISVTEKSDITFTVNVVSE